MICNNSVYICISKAGLFKSRFQNLYNMFLTINFVDGLYATEVRCSIPLLVQNCSNSIAVNWGPLSDMIISDKPCLLKMSRKVVTVALADVVDILTTSGNLLEASTTTR